MSITFNPKVGLSVEDTEAIRDAIRADWIAAFAEEGAPPLNVAPESPAGQLIDSEAVLVTAKDSEVLFVANNFNPETAEGIWQDALGKIYFQTRKINEPSVVPCVCTGLYGTVIPQGSMAQTDEGRVLISEETATIGADGTATVYFRARETGPILIGANTVNVIITTIPGWDTITNPTAGIPGRNIESRAEFEERRKKSVAMNAHGSAVALYSAVAAVAGVLDCVVLENETGAPVTKHGVEIAGHSVCVSVYGGDDGDIAEAIYLKKDGGCGTVGNTQITHTARDYFNAVYTYNILRPTPTPVKITADVVLSDGTPATIEDDIKEALISDFYGRNPQTKNGRVSMASRVYASRFYPAAIQTAGVVELLGISIALGTGDPGQSVNIPADEEPVLTADDITVNFTAP
jgi:uncharacterized phage protein gp47/JayE